MCTLGATFSNKNFPWLPEVCELHYNVKMLIISFFVTHVWPDFGVYRLFKCLPTQVIIFNEELHRHHDSPRGLQVYPEFCLAIALFAALREDRHAHGGLGERLLSCLHQENLKHTAFVDMSVKGGLPRWVHGGLPLDKSLSPLWKSEREGEGFERAS